MAGSSAATDRAGTYWFVGAAFKGHVEQTQRFFQEGIWEQYSPPEKNVVLVKTMLPGDAIVIKLAVVRKNPKSHAVLSGYVTEIVFDRGKENDSFPAHGRLADGDESGKVRRGGKADP